MSKVLITRSKLDSLATTISEKSGEPLPLTIDEMDAAVESISGGGVDTSQDTVDAAHLLDGYTAHDSTGSAIVGAYTPPTPTLQAKTHTVDSAGTETITADSGYDGLSSVAVSVPSADPYISFANPHFFTEGSRKWNITPTTVVEVGEGDTEGWLADGFSQSGNVYEVNAVAANTTVTPTTSAQTIGGANYMMEGAVTVAAMPSGSATAPATISGTSATVSTGTNTLTLSKTVSVTPTVSAGYVSSGTAGNSSVSLTANVTTQAAQTIYPSSSDQSIAASRYLTGAQTIKGVTTSNLTADNIKSGVTVTVGDSADADRILSVTGTYSGGSVTVKTTTMTNNSATATQIQFTSLTGQPKAFFCRCTSNLSRNSSNRYYYIADIRWDGSSTGGVTGNKYYVYNGQYSNQTTGYSQSYSNGTLTLTTTGSQTASPGSFFNGTYELVYVY